MCLSVHLSGSLSLSSTHTAIHPSTHQTKPNQNQTTGSLCLVYEFLEGGSLAALLRDRRKSYDVLQIALDVAEGMDYLHKRGVMHRDLKPDNLLLNREGRAVRVFVCLLFCCVCVCVWCVGV